ncbi:MAG: LysR family transcriptional regulator [Asticcacaulis sp.]
MTPPHLGNGEERKWGGKRRSWNSTFSATSSAWSKPAVSPRRRKTCLITQPTLSAGIKRLEEQLGVSLFVRSNKRVFLTTAGSRFLPRAKAILHEVNMASAEIAETAQGNVLRLGVLQNPAGGAGGGPAGRVYPATARYPLRPG